MYALLVSIATGEATVSVDGIVLIVDKAVIFFFNFTLLVGWLFPTNQKFLRNIPILGKFNLNQILAMGRGEYTTL